MTTINEIRQTIVHGYISAVDRRERRAVCDTARRALRTSGFAWTDAEHILQECIESAEWKLKFGEHAL